MTGNPGTGKTTVAKLLAEHMDDNNVFGEDEQASVEYVRVGSDAMHSLLKELRSRSGEKKRIMVVDNVQELTDKEASFSYVKYLL